MNMRSVRKPIRWAGGVAIACAVFLLSGCLVVPFPHTLVDAPRFTGRVLDASSHRPIAGAIVMIAGLPGTKVETDKSGKFTTGISRSIHLIGAYAYDNGCNVSFPPQKPQGLLLVSHPGYQDARITPVNWPASQPFEADRNVDMEDAGDIALHRLEK